VALGELAIGGSGAYVSFQFCKVADRKVDGRVGSILLRSRSSSGKFLAKELLSMVLKTYSVNSSFTS
jgi:hypothetical protein